MPKVSIVIVNFNNQRVLENCLPAVRENIAGLDAEVILSDNGSGDGSVEWVRQNFPEIRILENNANLGFAEANNRAFPLCNGQYILLLNPDTVVQGDAIGAMDRFLDQHPGAGVVGCKLLNGDRTRQISARSFPTLSTAFLGYSGLSWRRSQGRFCAQFEYGDWDGESARPVDWVCGAVLMIRREVLDQVGPIDSYFFLTYDEVDWCHRIKRAGWEVWYTPEGTILHLDRQSEPQSNPSPEGRLKYMTVERNSRVRYFVKHRGVIYSALVEALHVAACAALWIKAKTLGTRQPPVVVMEKRLMLVLYWRTLLRVPRALWCALRRAVGGARKSLSYPVFVNPYLANERR